MTVPRGGGGRVALGTWSSLSPREAALPRSTQEGSGGQAAARRCPLPSCPDPGPAHLTHAGFLSSGQRLQTCRPAASSFPEAATRAPGPLAKQPGMTSVPVSARGFAAQECRRGLREADAQGADVRPHFFLQVSTRSPSCGVDSGFTCQAAARPVPSLQAQGELRPPAVHTSTCAHGCGEPAAPGRLEQLRNCLQGDRLASQDLWLLSVCLPLVVCCFSIGFSPASPNLTFPPLFSLSLSSSLPASLEGSTEPGETALEVPQGRNWAGLCFSTGRVAMATRGHSICPTLGGQALSTGSNGNDSWFILGHMSAWMLTLMELE